MTISRNKRSPYKGLTIKGIRVGLWFERSMAILASANLILVFFDLSYVPLRNFWLQGKIDVFGVIVEVPLPPVTKWYDPVKGIEPERETSQYLETVDELEETLIGKSLESSEVTRILEELRFRSEEMIDTNPFQVANKTGTLEKIKNRMREHVPNPQDSAKQAFNAFWSQEYLSSQDAQEELDFFNEEIKPLIETNYYRPIGESGEPVDNFALLDFPFVVIFGLEFLARSWLISRNRTGLSWVDAMLWRWYDIFLLLPIFRWLRVIPVSIRLDQARLVDMEKVKKQASQGFVATIAEDLTEVVIVSTLNQVQGSVRRGEIGKMFSKQDANPYVDINNVNETAEIAKLMIQLLAKQVLPKVRPEAEAVIQHNITKLLVDLPAYQNVQQLPGAERFRRDLVEHLSSQIFQALNETLNSILEEDQVNDELIEKLIDNLSKVLGEEIQAQKTLDTIQSLLDDLIEEIKINYVERLSQEDVEEILEQTRALRQKTQASEARRLSS